MNGFLLDFQTKFVMSTCRHVLRKLKREAGDATAVETLLVQDLGKEGGNGSSELKESKLPFTIAHILLLARGFINDSRRNVEMLFSMSWLSDVVDYGVF